MQCLLDESFVVHGKHLTAEKFADWIENLAQPIEASVRKIINARAKNVFVIAKISKQSYANYWRDLYAAIQQERIPTSQRPDRIFT